MPQKERDRSCAQQNQDQDIFELPQQDPPGRNLFCSLNFIWTVLDTALERLCLAQPAGLALEFSKCLFDCLYMPEIVWFHWIHRSLLLTGTSRDFAHK